LGLAHLDVHGVAQLQKELDDLKIQAARSWDSTRKNLEFQWQEWEVRAKRAWSELSK